MSAATPERKAATIVPPAVILGTSKSNVGVQNTSTTPAADDVSAIAAGNQYITVEAIGADLVILFANTSALATALDSTTRGVPGANATNCKTVLAGTGPRDFILDPWMKFMGYRTKAGTGTIEYWASSGPSGGVDTIRANG